MWGHQRHQKAITESFRTLSTSQRFSPNIDWDKRIIPDTETGLNFIGDSGRPLNHWEGRTKGGIRAIPGIIDDGSAELSPPTTAWGTPPSSSGTIDTSEARKRRKSTNPLIERQILQAEKLELNDDSSNANWKHRIQQRAHERVNLSDEEEEEEDEDETDDEKLESKPRSTENRADSGLVQQQTPSKRRKLTTKGHTREQQPPQQLLGQLRALPSRGEEFSAGVMRPLSNIEPETSTDRGSEGHRRPVTVEDTYSIGDTRQYLRCYMTYLYPLCSLEICDDSVEDLVIDTLRKTGGTNTEQSQTTVLCVYSMLALGARYAKHAERAREFFWSARATLAHLPEGEKHELRVAEALNCMAMYAMGVESSIEVLGYLNRALDICAINGAVNGPVTTSCLHWKHLLMLARIDKMVDSTEETRIELRERAWLWFKDAYEHPKESTPYVVSRIKSATYPISLTAMRTIDNCISVMVRITSGIVALGWGWQNWKQLPPNSDTQTKEVILEQHVHWLQWLDRVVARVNETQPLGDEIPEVIVTDLRLNLCALYARCYLAVDMNDSALQWAIKYVKDLRQTVSRQSGNLLFADMDVILQICETMNCEHLLDDISVTLGSLIRSISSVVFLKRRCDRLRARLQRQRSDSLDLTRRKDLLSFASPLKSSEQLIPLNPDDYLSEPQQQQPQQQQPPPPPLPQPHPTYGSLNPLPSLGRSPPHHRSPEDPPYLHPSLPASPDTQPSLTQPAAQRKSSFREVKKDRKTSNEKKEVIPTTITTTTTTTTTSTKSLLPAQSSYNPSPNILAQLQHLQRQIGQQRNTATAVNESYGEELNTHNRNNTDPTSGRPPSRLGKSDIHDLIHHDDEHKREGPAQQDDAGVRGASSQDGGELGERRCLECNCTDTPEWRKGPGGPHTLCNACGLRWNRSALNLKKKGPLTYEEQLFAKFSINRKITS